MPAVLALGTCVLGTAPFLALLLLEVGAADGLVELALLLGAV